MTRPFILPDSPTRADVDAYAYLCERPDIWTAWAEHARPYMSAGAVASFLRRGLARPIPISSTHVRSIGRIYRASTKANRS